MNFARQGFILPARLENGSFTGYSEDDRLAISDDFIKRLTNDLNQLKQQAYEIIRKEYGEEGTLGLALTDILFDKSGCYDAFALGYDAGESPAGQLYLLVKFDDQFQPDRELVFETY